MDFLTFLSGFIKSEGLNNLKLAEKLEVPAATISHLLSGRNKPSLDFIQKLIRAYPTLDLYQILDLQKYRTEERNKEIKTTEKHTTQTTPKTKEGKILKKIVLLYKDNSFEEYNL